MNPPEEQSVVLVPLPPVERDPARIYMAGLASNTRKDMAGRLRRVAQMLGCGDPRQMPWSAMRYEHVVALRTRLIEQGLAASTINSHLSALRGIAHEAWNLGQMNAEDYYRIKEVKNVRGASAQGAGAHAR